MLAFYSSPDDVQAIVKDNGDYMLPFATTACNRSSLVAVGDESGCVRLIESAAGEKPGFTVPYLSFQLHENAIFDLSWSHDDHQIATASGDQTIRIFDVTKQQKLAVLKNHDNSVKTVSYNPHNPSILVSSARDGTFNIWDLRIAGTKASEGRDIVTTLQPVMSIAKGHTLPKKTSTGSITAAVWLSETKIATACERDAIIKVWDTRSPQIKRRKPTAVESTALPPIHALPNHRTFGINSLAVSPDSQRVYAVCKDSVVYAYSTQAMAHGPIHAYSHPSFHAETFYVKGALSRDGAFLATGSSDNVAVLFPTDERHLDRRVSSSFAHAKGEHPLAAHLAVGRGVALVRGHDKEVTDVTWTENGELVSLGDDFQARCWRRDGAEAERMRTCGEEGGKRWAWGWADEK